MDINSLIMISLACAAGAISPGPSLIVVIRNTIAGGRKQGVMTAIGHGIGLGLYALIAVMGLASSVLTNEKVFTILQLIGAIVLILLSFNMIFHSPLKISNQYTVSGRQGFIEGFMISFLNPKILVFFLAVFSQFINQEITNYNRFILGFLAGIIDITWYVLVAVALSGTRLIERFKANKWLVDRSIGLALFFLAIILIIRTLKIEIFQGLVVVANG